MILVLNDSIANSIHFFFLQIRWNVRKCSSGFRMYVEKCELSIEFEMVWMWLASGTNEEANKNKAVWFGFAVTLYIILLLNVF